MRSSLLQKLLKLIKGVPTPKALLQEHWRVTAGSLVILFIMHCLGKDSLLVWDFKDLVKGLISIALASLIYLVLWGVRHALEKRPTPIERVERIRRLAARLLHAPRAGETARRLKMAQAKSPNRKIRPANTRELVAIMTRMNCKLFARSVHGQGFVEKMERNLAHTKKNPWVIRLLGMTKSGIERMRTAGGNDYQEAGEFPAVGFSHVLPISKATYDKYVIKKNGQPGIEDTAFSADHICGPCEKAYAFLVFTVAIDAAYIRKWELGANPGLRGELQASRNVNCT
jgi:hypothetical protein